MINSQLDILSNLVVWTTKFSATWWKQSVIMFSSFFLFFLHFPSFFVSKHLAALPLCICPCAGCWDTAGISEIHPCPWWGTVIRSEEDSKLLPGHRPENGGQQLAWNGLESRQRDQSPIQAEKLVWLFRNGDKFSCSINTDWIPLNGITGKRNFSKLNE